MNKALFVAAVALGLGACTFPQTKMQPVGETQMQTQQQQPPPPASAEAPPATSAAPSSAQSAAATR